MIKVFDNLLTKKQKDEVLDMHLHEYFPWYLCSKGFGTSQEEYHKKIKDKHCYEYTQFVHTYIADGIVKSNLFKEIEKVFNHFIYKTKQKVKKLHRIKSNYQPMYLYDKTKMYNTPHTDYALPHRTMLYYINDSDGCTFFFENNKIIKKVEPKKGRLVLFDGLIKHAGCHPKKNKNRIVLNINYE